MKKLLLMLVLYASGAKAQYFQRWFNFYSGTNYKDELFYDGLCTRYNYSGVNTNYYHVGVGFTNVSTNYALGNYDELRFARTDKSGIILQNFGLALSEKTDTLKYNSHAHAVCEIKNGKGTGGYMVVGNVTSNSKTGASVTGGSDALIARVLNDGSVPNRWRFNFGTGADELNCVIPSVHFPGYFYACGTSVHSGFSTVIVMKFDSLVKVSWAYTYHFDAADAKIFNNDCKAYGIAENPLTGNLVVVGKFKDSASADVDGLMFRLGINGAVISAKRHNLGTSDEYRAIRVTSDSNFIICGFSNQKASGSIYYDMWLTKMDTAGGIFFSKLIRQPNSTTYGLDVVEHLNASNQPEYFITGSRYDNKKVLASTSIVKTDNTGKGIISSAYDTLFPYNYHFMGIDYAANDATSPGLAVFSNILSIGNWGSRSDAYMLKTNFNLGTCTEYCAADTPVTYKVTIQVHTLENYKDSNYGKKNLNIYKIKYNTGSICSEASIDCKNNLVMNSDYQSGNAKNNSISDASLEQNIPNPFNRVTIIKYTLPQQYNSAKIVITNNAGKIFKAINISGSGKGSLQFDASLLISGVYTYSLYVDGKLVETKQMILAK